MNERHHWGFTAQAERWNGRLAMLGFVIALPRALSTTAAAQPQARLLQCFCPQAGEVHAMESWDEQRQLGDRCLGGES